MVASGRRGGIINDGQHREHTPRNLPNNAPSCQRPYFLPASCWCSRSSRPLPDTPVR
jgi:hypothetical protein